MPETVFINRFLFTCFYIVIVSLSSSIAASEIDLDSGKNLYNKVCASCHGQEAKGNDALGGPALAGQHEAYLSSQLLKFSTGIRGSADGDSFGQQMAAMSSLVSSEKDRANVSAYLSFLKKPNASVTDEKTANGNNAGYKIYQASCGACHGADASGNERLNSPSLVGLSSDYLFRQYDGFLNGTRGSHESDKYGRQMRMIANTVTEQEKIDAVMAYIVSLQD